MPAMDASSLKKEAKIKKLKELRKMMQKRMTESFSGKDSKSMVSKVLEKSEPKKEEKEEKSEESKSLLRKEMQSFFQRGSKNPPSGKTKVITAEVVVQPAKKAQSNRKK